MSSSTATPESTTKPTAAEMENGMSRTGRRGHNSTHDTPLATWEIPSREWAIDDLLTGSDPIDSRNRLKSTASSVND